MDLVGRKYIPDLESIGMSVRDEDEVFRKKYESGVRTIRCYEGLKGR